ncbi:MAG: 50S ribosomal protein L15 [Gammaproteobacteria bacterium]|nr:50S ribosomal protein L15 [Gammaproteobacteria bacterium]
MNSLSLNNLKPAPGSRATRKRAGRGMGTGFGKTCGRGHKGQRSRAGGYHKVGFEGGQMPLQRRLPKIGFRSRKTAETAELRLHELAKVNADPVDIQALKDAGLVHAAAKRAKVILSGTIDTAVNTKGLEFTPGARKAVEAAGGKVQA